MHSSVRDSGNEFRALESYSLVRPMTKTEILKNDICWEVVVEIFEDENIEGVGLPRVGDIIVEKSLA